MKITCSFDSYEEFIDFANGGGERAIIDIVTKEAREALEAQQAEKSSPKKPEAQEEAIREPEAVPQAGDWTPGGGDHDDSIVNPSTGKRYEEEEAEEAQKATKKSTKAKKEPVQEAEEAPQASEEAPKVDRIALRKMLANINKKTGENMASKLVKEFGVDKFTEVKDEDLPALQKRAEEVLNA